MISISTAENKNSNNLSVIPPSISAAKALVSLNLSFNKIKIFPNIFNMISLEFLDLKKNYLNMIPMEISYLQNLQSLILSENCLTELPETISLLTALKTFECRKNKIRVCPSLVNLVNLEILDFQENALVELPLLPKAEKLCVLLFDFNQITSLNIDNLSSLPQLTTLSIRDNKIKELPERINMLSNLVQLNIENNDLSDLPPNLGKIKSLKVINLTGNILKRIRSELRASGAEQIKKYLLTRLTDGSSEGK